MGLSVHRSLFDGMLMQEAPETLAPKSGVSHHNGPPLIYNMCVLASQQDAPLKGHAGVLGNPCPCPFMAKNIQKQLKHIL